MKRSLLVVLLVLIVMGLQAQSKKQFLLRDSSGYGVPYNQGQKLRLPGLVVDGNVGIGAITPSQKLTIGQGWVNTDNGFGLSIFDTHGTATPTVWMNDTDWVNIGTGGSATGVIFNNYYNVVLHGGIQLDTINYDGPAHGPDKAGIAYRRTNEPIGDPSLVMRAHSYQLETMFGGDLGIKSAVVIDENSRVWIGTDFTGGAWALKDRLEVSGAMSIGESFTSRGTDTTAPANGLLVEGHVSFGSKSLGGYDFYNNGTFYNADTIVSGGVIIPNAGIQFATTDGAFVPSGMWKYNNYLFVQLPTSGIRILSTSGASDACDIDSAGNQINTGSMQATNYKATAMPSDSTGLATGVLWFDTATGIVHRKW